MRTNTLFGGGRRNRPNPSNKPGLLNTYPCADARHHGNGRAAYEGGYCKACQDRQAAEYEIHQPMSEKAQGEQ